MRPLRQLLRVIAAFVSLFFLIELCGVGLLVTDLLNRVTAAVVR